MLINRARHVRYTGNGKPVVRALPSLACRDTWPEFLSARHITYTSSGKPKLAVGFECCDAISPNRVETGCWPPDGITDVMYIYLYDVATCGTARGKKVKLTYSSGAWTGSVDLRGGTLSLSVTCNSALDFMDLGKFVLSYSGCANGSLDGQVQCTDPITIDFGQDIFEICCDCNQTGLGPTTTTAAEIHFYGIANCPDVFPARHIDYTGNGLPVVAIENPCVFSQTDNYQCGGMTCPLVATVTSLSGCGCMAGTYNLDYVTIQWENVGISWGTCGNAGSMSVICTDVGFDFDTHQNIMRLDISVVCGTTNTGTGSVTILANQLENLDTTIDVTMSDTGSPAACCNGQIRVRLMR